jgi:fructose-bisphosphate aldolase class I
MADGHGILAMDESAGTCNRRFEALGIPPTYEMRRDYRELLLTTPGLGASISGAILCDETLMQSRADGSPMSDLATKGGILLGIKVDTGAKPMALHPGEAVTEGLDGLRQRLELYRSKGARFAKWRAVLSVDAVTPSRGCMAANALGLARYAGLCQEAGLLPMVEPEVLMDGGHSLQRCRWVTEMALHEVFSALYAQRVDLRAMLLKPNMVLPGAASAEQEGLQEVAEATLQCLLASVPAAVPGIAFLSGGQSPQLATARLKAINGHHQTKPPWRLTFSFSRALQEPVLALWGGKQASAGLAQVALLERAAANAAASMG